MFFMVAILLLSALLNFSADEQPKVVTGRLISFEEKEPIKGATIIVNGTTTGTVSNSDGYFELNVKGAALISVYTLGYTTLIMELPRVDSVQLDSIPLFWNYSRPLNIDGTIERKWPTKWIRGKYVMVTIPPNDKLLDKYQTEIIPRQCFSLDSTNYIFKVISDDEVLLNLNEPTECR